ncbi:MULTISPECIES: ribosome silencing factor [Fructobacillus]|jgi:ribosome-associated protein|uniref:Ribosomal silencing factor RsfS n=2 Tax=Fructobacillus TaxID=559173 RepID=A0A3F3HBU2_9LACO|nr:MULTISPECIES: ribosome silencing factor [Fructobacillus]CAK1239506.1 Ribosomal silencing factor RsfS [Fructobacillus cardui]KMK54139.1 Ribosomal silencing factor RsfS [Fructobacillus sp. EFB-N1]NLS38783.1 ribosome silencing factor [Fructobacillus tropaeoli]CAK1239331.1 Ribosomal silencing factor RsfS [Fructobacillus tropaeoli]CAK1242743.1 Ribosomal silencing factor RsfS [Fructobacillus cardui]
MTTINSKDLLQTVVSAIDSKHGDRITALDMQKVSLLADYFVIASAGSSRQVQAIVREVKEEVQKAGGQVLNIEGYDRAEWVSLDLGDIIVHVFDEESRDFYHLDRLWFDAENVDLTNYLAEEVY